MAAIKPGDWVTCQWSSVIGIVRRVAGDGTWADVELPTLCVRMFTVFLTVQYTIPLRDASKK